MQQETYRRKTIDSKQIILAFITERNSCGLSMFKRVYSSYRTLLVTLVISLVAAVLLGLVADYMTNTTHRYLDQQVMLQLEQMMEFSHSRVEMELAQVRSFLDEWSDNPLLTAVIFNEVDRRIFSHALKEYLNFFHQEQFSLSNVLLIKESQLIYRQKESTRLEAKLLEDPQTLKILARQGMLIFQMEKRPQEPRQTWLLMHQNLLVNGGLSEELHVVAVVNLPEINQRVVNALNFSTHQAVSLIGLSHQGNWVLPFRQINHSLLMVVHNIKNQWQQSIPPITEHNHIQVFSRPLEQTPLHVIVVTDWEVQHHKEITWLQHGLATGLGTLLIMIPLCYWLLLWYQRPQKAVLQKALSLSTSEDFALATTNHRWLGESSDDLDDFTRLDLLFELQQTQLQNFRDHVKDLKQTHERDLQGLISEKDGELRRQLVFTNQLSAKVQQLEAVLAVRQRLIEKINAFRRTRLKHLMSHLKELEQHEYHHNPEPLREVAREVEDLDQVLRPITSFFKTDVDVANRRGLLADNQRGQELMIKTALKGSGVDLDLVKSLEHGYECLREQTYDILIFSDEYMELALHAVEHFPEMIKVFTSGDQVRSWLPKLQQHSFIANIITRNGHEQVFNIRDVVTTVRKLISRDLFGLEKYLNWGIDVYDHKITSSRHRKNLVDQLEHYLDSMGLRKSVRTRCLMVAEELLMNAIYDAPVDRHGKPLFNHLPRTVQVDLSAPQQGRLRYACDGMSLAISVDDPFGALSRDTILDYLHTCYFGNMETSSSNKGGAGKGLFQIMKTCDLLVINVKPRIKTEAIALFNLGQDNSHQDDSTSFHYFLG